MPRVAVVAVLAAVSSVALAADVPTARSSRPNILWISAEDLSAGTLGCYGGPARTRRIDALAAGGLRFDAAFSAAPVCAPSRSAIITAVMPTSLGSLPMRCRATLPPPMSGFPKLLREAGYHCTNNSKTDYNLAPFDAGWNESGRNAHWRSRTDAAQPFFAVFNLTVTHESGLFGDRPRQVRESLPESVRSDPASIAVPPFYPDTPVIRTALAHRLDLTASLDRDVGRLLDELAADGLVDSTIVLFWGDHGEGIPHGKRFLTEHGLRVPLVVHVPERFASLATLPDGRPASGVSRDLVSLLDLGPTMLDLAGIAIPTWMEGRSFLGPHATRADAVIGAADRMDAAPGFGRSVRDANFRYVRNFLPWIDGDDLPDYASGVPITAELRAARAAGALPAGAAWFARTKRPAEELYDAAHDPDQLRDLAGEPSHAAALERMRASLRAWMRSTRDTGVLPEAMLRREARQAGSEWAIFHPGTAGEPFTPGTAADAAAAARYDAILAAAWAVADPPDADAAATRLAGRDAAVRFWAVQAIGWHASVKEAWATEDGVARLSAALRDTEPAVRIAAARWLVASRTPAAPSAIEALAGAVRGDDADVRMMALVVIDQLGDLGRPLWEAATSIDLAKDPEFPAEYSKRTIARLKRRMQPAR